MKLLFVRRSIKDETFKVNLHVGGISLTPDMTIVQAVQC